MKSYRPIMFVGTGSGVGKSLLAAGMCRILRQDGFHPAPFKAQNMSLNSYVTPEGGEIGRAQALQAAAAGIAPHTDMNPILLKPSGESRSQLVLHGEARGDLTARKFFGDRRDYYFDEAYHAFQRLSSHYSPVVLEGAGSISELNLKSRDIVNMAMALRTGAAVYLVADIERGGVFGSVHGNIALLTPEERRAVRGIIVNRFRGDMALFDEGRRILEELTGIPVVGVLPLLRDLYLEEEDSLSLDDWPRRSSRRRGGDGHGNRQEGGDPVQVAVVRTARISNHSDFDLLSRVPGLHLYFTDEPEEVSHADLVILPGSKNTIEDLWDLRQRGVDRAILDVWKRGGHVLGICGGFQMLGESVHDPHGIESDRGTLPGLGLLPVSTTLLSPKVTKQIRFRIPGAREKKHGGDGGAISPGEGSLKARGETSCNPYNGYEIHMGRSEAEREFAPLFFREERPAGMNGSPGRPGEGIRGERCYGTYIHGALDHPAVLDYLLNNLMGLGLDLPREDAARRREESLDRFASHLRRHLDLGWIYREMGHA